MTTEKEVQEESSTHVEAKASAPAYEELFTRYQNAVSDNAKYRNERTENRAKIQELEEQARKVADLERQVSESTSAHRSEVAMAKLEALAIKEGIVDSDALKLIDQSNIKFDKDGKPQNLAELLTDFKATKPHFFGSVSTSSVSKAPIPATTGTKEAMEMSDTEWKAAKKKYGL